MPGGEIYRPPNVHDLNAINLDKAIKAAPTIKYHPDLGLAAVRAGGNIVENAQSLSGFHLANTLFDTATDHLRANPQVHQAFAHVVTQKTLDRLGTTSQAMGGERGVSVPGTNFYGIDRLGETQTGTSLGGIEGGGNVSAGNQISRLWTDAGHVGQSIGGWAERNLSAAGLKNMEGYAMGSLDTFTRQLPDWIGGINPQDPFGSMLHHGSSSGYGLPTLFHDTLTNISNQFKDKYFNLHWWEKQRAETAVHEAQYQNQKTPGVRGVVGGTLGRAGNPDLLATTLGLLTPQQVANAKQSFLQMVGQQFDNWNHFYRYVVMSYEKGGFNGMMNALTPMLAGAVLGLVGSTVLGPDAAAAGVAMGADLSTTIGTDAAVTATEGDIAGQMGANLGTAASDTASQTATATAEGQTAQTLNEAEQAGANATKGEAAVKTFGSNPIVRGIGQAFKIGAEATQAPELFGANVVPQIWHDKALWDASRKPTAQLGTIGQGISQFLFHRNVSLLSGTVDAITSFIEAPMMGGRALGLEREATQLTASRSLAALSGDQIRAEVGRNTQVARALDIIAGFGQKGKLVEIETQNAAGNVVKTEVKDTAGKIYRMFPSLAPVIPELVKAMEENGATRETLVDTLANLADATTMLTEVRMPTAGIVSLLRKAKVGDNAAINKLSEFFGQEAMRYDENTGKIVKDIIEPGSRKSIYAVGQMMQLAGESSSKINAVLSYLSETSDPVAWSNVYINATFGLVEKDFDQSFTKLLLRSGEITRANKGTLKRSTGYLGMDLQTALKNLDDIREPQLRRLENLYQEYRSSWHSAISEWLGGMGVDSRGEFAVQVSGASRSMVERDGKEFAAGVHGLHIEPFILPDFREIKEETWKLMSNMFKNEGLSIVGGRVADVGARDLLAHDFIMGTNKLNEWINERFFKPLALLTPGWALRVSISELGLNTARIGPRNMLAGWLGDTYIRSRANMITTYRKIVDRHVTNLGKDINDLETTLKEENEKQAENKAKIETLKAQKTAAEKEIKSNKLLIASIESKRLSANPSYAKMYENLVNKGTQLETDLTRIESETTAAESELNPDHYKLQQGLEMSIAKKQAERDSFLGKKFVSIPPPTADQLMREGTPADIWEQAVQPEVKFQMNKLKNEIETLQEEIRRTFDENAKMDLEYQMIEKMVLHDKLDGSLTARSFAAGPTADQLEKELAPSDLYRKAFRKGPETPAPVRETKFFRNREEAKAMLKRLREQSVKDLERAKRQLVNEMFDQFGIHPPEVSIEVRLNKKTGEAVSRRKVEGSVILPPVRTRGVNESKAIYEINKFRNPGSYDWVERLPESTVKRLESKGWMRRVGNEGTEIDNIADAFAAARPGAGKPFYEELLDQIRLHDSLDHLIRNPNRPVPNWIDLDELQRLINPESVKPFTLEQLHAGADSEQVIRGLKTNYREQRYAEDFIEQEMRNVVDDQGRAPWEMTTKEYSKYLRDLSDKYADILDETLTTNGVLTPEQEEELQKLEIKMKQFENFEWGKTQAQMHQYLVRQAELAGQDVPARVYEENLSTAGPLGAPATKYKGKFQISKTVYENMAMNIKSDLEDRILAIHEATKDARQELMQTKAYKGNFSIRNDLERSYEEQGLRGITDRGYTVNATTGENIKAIVNGVVAGASQSMLDMIGKEEFYKASSFLVFQHADKGTYKPAAVDGVHSGDHVLETFVDRDPQSIVQNGRLKTKMTTMRNPQYYAAGESEKGYTDGFFYETQGYAFDKTVGNPAMKIYRRFYNMYPNDPELVHNLAVPEIKKFLDSLPEEQVSKFSRHFAVGKGDGDMSPHESWAEALTDDIEHLISHQSEERQFADVGATNVKWTYNPNAYKLVNDMADNNLPAHVNQFYQEYMVGSDGTRYSADELPAKVIARRSENWRRSDIVEQISQVGHARVLGPIVNQMSRNPVYVYEFVRAREALNDKVVQGLLSADQADVVAQTMAAQKMVRFIHNPADKLKFEDLMRSFAPFYFAQNQAWRRMGRLFAENPGAFMQYLRAMYGVVQWSSQMQNKQGMAIFPIPGMVLFGIPLTGSLSSLTTMDPLAPGSDATQTDAGPGKTIWDTLTPKFGPIPTFLTELVMDKVPGRSNRYARDIANFVEGPIAMNQSLGQNLYQDLVPNSLVRNLYEGVAGVSGFQNMTTDSYMTAKIEAFTQYATQLQEQEWNKLRKERFSSDSMTDNFLRRTAFAQWQSKTFGTNATPTIMNHMLDEANRHAAVMWLAKLVGSFSPVSIGFGQADDNIRSQLNGYVTAKVFKGNYMAAVDQFIKDHPYATLQSLYETKSSNGNYMGPENKELYIYVENNMGVVQQYPLAALAFGPNTTKDPNFYEPANQVLLSSNLRYRETPEQFYNSFLVAIGNAWYYNAVKPMYEANRHSSGAYTWKENIMQEYGQNYNPSWYSNYLSAASSTEKVQALDQLKEMLELPQYKNYTVNGVNVADIYRQLIDAYNKDLKPLLDQAAKGEVTYQSVQDWWQENMAAIAAQNPEAAPGINAVFSSLG